MANVIIIPILKDDIPEDYDYSHFEYINKVCMIKIKNSDIWLISGDKLYFVKIFVSY